MTDAEMAEALLSLLKTKLRITYTESDEELTLIINNAIPDLRERIGSNDIDFTKNGAEQSFLLNYCKYHFYGQDDEFFTRYQNEYLTLRQIYSTDEDTEDTEA